MYVCVALSIQHVPYCHLRPVGLDIFPHLINGTIFNEVIEHKICVLIFSTASETFLILRTG